MSNQVMYLPPEVIEEIVGSANELARILSQEIRATPLIPEKDSGPLPVPLEVEISEDDERRAHRGFDKYVKDAEPDLDLEGLLSSDVLREEPEETQEPTAEGLMDEVNKILGREG